MLEACEVASRQGLNLVVQASFERWGELGSQDHAYQSPAPGDPVQGRVGQGAGPKEDHNG